MKNDIFLVSLIYFFCVCTLFCQNDPKNGLMEINTVLEKKKEHDLGKLKNLVETFVELDSLEQREFNRISLFSKDEYYPFLKKYSERLWPELTKHFKTNIYFREALGLIELPDSIKDSLINYRYTETHIKAALGDRTSESLIIERFNEIIKSDLQNDSLSKTFVQLKKQLLYINSRATLRAFFTAMASDKTYFPEYDSTLKNRLHWSFFESFRLTYSRVYKYEGIVSSLHRGQFVGLNSRTYKMDSYFKEIENYIFRRHSLKMTIDAPFIAYGDRNIVEDQLVVDPNNDN